MNQLFHLLLFCYIMCMTHDVYNERNSMKKYIIFVILMSTISAMDPDELSKRATKAMQSTISSRVFDLLREENLEKPYAVSEFAYYLEDPGYQISAPQKHLFSFELGSLTEMVKNHRYINEEVERKATIKKSKLLKKEKLLHDIIK